MSTPARASGSDRPTDDNDLSNYDSVDIAGKFNDYPMDDPVDTKPSNVPDRYAETGVSKVGGRAIVNEIAVEVSLSLSSDSR